VIGVFPLAVSLLKRGEPPVQRVVEFTHAARPRPVSRAQSRCFFGLLVARLAVRPKAPPTRRGAFIPLTLASRRDVRAGPARPERAPRGELLVPWNTGFKKRQGDTVRASAGVSVAVAKRTVVEKAARMSNGFLFQRQPRGRVIHPRLEPRPPERAAPREFSAGQATLPVFKHTPDQVPRLACTPGWTLKDILRMFAPPRDRPASKMSPRARNRAEISRCWPCLSHARWRPGPTRAVGPTTWARQSPYPPSPNNARRLDSSGSCSPRSRMTPRAPPIRCSVLSGGDSRLRRPASSLRLPRTWCLHFSCGFVLAFFSSTGRRNVCRHRPSPVHPKRLGMLAAALACPASPPPTVRSTDLGMSGALFGARLDASAPAGLPWPASSRLASTISGSPRSGWREPGTGTPAASPVLPRRAAWGVGPAPAPSRRPPGARPSAATVRTSRPAA